MTDRIFEEVLAAYHKFCEDSGYRPAHHVETALAQSLSTGSLSFDRDYIGPKQAVAVASILHRIPKLHSLNFSRNGLSDELLFDALCAGLERCPSISHLDVSHNPLDPICAARLLKLCKTNTNIIFCCVSGCENFSPAEVAHIALQCELNTVARNGISSEKTGIGQAGLDSRNSACSNGGIAPTQLHAAEGPRLIIKPGDGTPTPSPLEPSWCGESCADDLDLHLERLSELLPLMSVSEDRPEEAAVAGVSKILCPNDPAVGLNLFPSYLSALEAVRRFSIASFEDRSMTSKSGGNTEEDKGLLLFLDSEFPPTMVSILGANVFQQVIAGRLASGNCSRGMQKQHWVDCIVWKRLSQIVPTCAASCAECVARSTLSFGDQTVLNVSLCCDPSAPVRPNPFFATNYFCSALNCVRSMDDIARGLCVKALPSVGLYVFRFFKGRQQIDVVVDDYVPLLPCNRREIHNNNDGEASATQEKCFCVLCGDGEMCVESVPVVSLSPPLGKQEKWKLLTLTPRKLQSSDSNSLNVWSILCEKAYAKLHGGYFAISSGGGSCAGALEDLTSGVCLRSFLRFPPKSQELFALYDSLRMRLREKRALFAAIKTELYEEYKKGKSANTIIASKQSQLELQQQGSSMMNRSRRSLPKLSVEAAGLIPYAAYAIISVTVFNEMMFVRLGSPVPGVRWRGRWGSGSPEEQSGQYRDFFQPDTVFAFSSSLMINHVFWMPLEDFISFFNTLYELQYCTGGADTIRGHIKSHIVSIDSIPPAVLPSMWNVSPSVNEPLWETNPTFIFSTAVKDTPLLISLLQPDRTLLSAVHPEKGEAKYAQLQMHAWKVSSAVHAAGMKQYFIPKDSSARFQQTPLVDNRRVAFQTTLQPDSPLQVVITAQQQGARRITAVPEGNTGEDNQCDDQCLHTNLHWIVAGGNDQHGSRVEICAYSSKPFKMIAAKDYLLPAVIHSYWRSPNCAGGGRAQTDPQGTCRNPQFVVRRIHKAQLDEGQWKQGPVPLLVTVSQQATTTYSINVFGWNGPRSENPADTQRITAAKLSEHYACPEKRSILFSPNFVAEAKTTIPNVFFLVDEKPSTSPTAAPSPSSFVDLTLMPVTWNPGEEGGFTLVVYAPIPIEITAI